MNYKRKYARVAARHRRYSRNGYRLVRGLAPFLPGQTTHDVEWPPEFSCVSCWPKWHDVLYNVRPWRRSWKAVVAKIKRGEDFDGIPLPLNHKPLQYYW